MLVYIISFYYSKLIISIGNKIKNVLNYTNRIYTFLILKNVHIWLTIIDYLPGHVSCDGEW